MSDYEKGFHSGRPLADYQSGSQEWQGAQDRELIRKRQSEANSQTPNQMPNNTGAVSHGFHFSPGVSLRLSLLVWGGIICAIAAFWRTDEAIIAFAFLVITFALLKAGDELGEENFQGCAVFFALAGAIFVCLKANNQLVPEGSLLPLLRAHPLSVPFIVATVSGVYILGRAMKRSKLGFGDVMKVAVCGVVVLFCIRNGALADFEKDSFHASPHIHLDAGRH